MMAINLETGQVRVKSDRWNEIIISRMTIYDTSLSQYLFIFIDTVVITHVCKIQLS